MTTFAHIGDLHLGPGPRNEDRIRALRQVIDEGLAIKNLGAWLIPGDLNHGRMTIDDRNFLAEQLTLAAMHAPVLITPGNHDVPGDLQIFSRLKATWPVYVVDTPQVFTLPLATGDAASVFVLPYPTRAGLLAAGAASSQVHDAAREALEHIFMEAAEQLAKARAMGDLTLMIGHVNVAGSDMSAGQPNIGREIELDAALLTLLGDCYKGLNHIHKGQEIFGVHYAGSLCRLDWGEIEPKRWLRIDYERVAHHQWVYSVSPRRVDVAPMYHVEGELTRDTFTWHVRKGPGGDVEPPPASWKGCEVRVRYHYKQSERSVLSEAQIYAEFAECAKLYRDPVADPDRAVRAPQVAAARTLPEKLSAWCDISGHVATDSVIAKLAQLERSEPQAVMTWVAALIAQIEQDVIGAQPVELEEEAMPL